MTFGMNSHRDKRNKVMGKAAIPVEIPERRSESAMNTQEDSRYRTMTVPSKQVRLEKE